MTRKIITTIVFSLLSIYNASAQKAGHKDFAPYDLRCEYMVNPIGLDTAFPRLSWKDPTPLKRQTAYQILVASDPDSLSSTQSHLWDSGKIYSSCSSNITYDGQTIPCRSQRFWWVVRVWNENDSATAWSEPAFWIYGPGQWRAQWIGDKPDSMLCDYKRYVAENHDKPDFDQQLWENPPMLPSPLLRKNFIAGKEIESATIYATAIGYYELYINGKKVDARQLAPEYTNYDRTLQYQAYDVTPLLKRGQNSIGAVLADGWALGRNATVKWLRKFPHRGFFANDRRLLAQLEITYRDGTHDVISTDGSWRINRDGHIIMADNFKGEVIDNRKLIARWTHADYDDTSWDTVYVQPSMPHREIVAQPNAPIKPHITLSPKKIWEREGSYMIDFGQNIAGHIRLKIKGYKGQRINVRHGEWLNTDGSLYTRSLGYAEATDIFILSGDPDIFEPTFTYHGFQYVEITGVDKPITTDMVEAVAISSAQPIAGDFKCSNEKLNKLYRNILWTQRNNMFSILHDNPSRDERTGAAGDIQIFAQSAIFNMDMAAFFSKYCRDMMEVAHNGQFYSMYPSLSRSGEWDGFIGAPGWSETGLILPWRIYENYADTTVLAKLYPFMKSHVDAIHRENPDLIWRVRHNHNGDWLNANTISASIDPTYDTRSGATPDDLFATAFFAYASNLLSKISSVLGHKEESQVYETLYNKIKEKFISEYVNQEGNVAGNSQGAYSMALYLDLLPSHLRQASFDKLLKCLEHYDFRLSTGFITTPMMMQLLSDFNRSDIAYTLLESQRFPSWLSIVNNGATTVWERWDSWFPGKGFQNEGMNSLDHVAFGAVSEWMFRNILGINPDIEYPGYKHFILKPTPGGTLTWATGHYDSPAGRIESSWKINNGLMEYQCTVPPNSTATLILPNEAPKSLDAGTYIFTSKLQ
ncbi:MAG: glycoside hydrolase family 78 protein [Clostridiales bacterium]|nr:glycoside hydrolase family 78 protein [Clostridiales bacterium]